MKTIFRIALAVTLAAIGSTGWGQNVFNKFEPATGVLKGSSTSYVTTAAVAADIKGLWTGTCDATTFLRGDGSCTTPTGTGITFSMPSGFTVTGSPGSTISVSTTLSGVLKGTGSAFTTAAAADIKGLWSGTCDATTFLRGDGACAAPSGASGATPTGTIGLTAVAGSASTFTRSDGTAPLSQAIVPTWTGSHTFSAASTVPLTVNNNGSTDTIHVNGIATRTALIELAGNGNTPGTGSLAVGQDSVGAGHVLQRLSSGSLILGAGGANYMTMDSSGHITFSTPAAGGQTSYTFNGRNGNNTALFTTGAGAGTAYGVYIQAGTNSSDYTLILQSQAGAQYLEVFGDGGVTLGAPTGGDPGAGAFNTASDIKINNVSVCRSDGTNCPAGSSSSTSATLTSTGCSANSTVTGYFAKSGNVGTLTISAFACISNATTYTFTGFPAAYQPAHQASCAALVEDNTVDGKVGSIVIAASGTISLTVASSSGGSWTASGTKGFNNAITCSYPLN